MQPDELEQLVGRALQSLPEPRAPQTLMPRVLAAARHAASPWYARPWRTWPVQWQVAWAVVLVVLVSAGAVALPAARDLITTASPALASTSQRIDDTAGVLRQAEAARDLVWVVWRLVFAPAMAYAAIVTVLMSLLCVGFAGAVTHFASRKAISS